MSSIPPRPDGDDPNPADPIDREDTARVVAADAIDRVLRQIGHVACWFNGILLLAIVTQVFLRYAFSSGQTWLEELQWHFYATAMMFGLSYALVTDTHVRVDVLHSHFSVRTKRLVEIFSILFLLAPFIFVIFLHSLPFVVDAWRVMEGSDSAGGLPYRFIIKSMIPIGFGLLALAAASRLLRDVTLLIRGA